MAAASDGVRIQAEEFGQNAVAAVAQLDGFQPGEQTALLLVQQAVEKQDGGFQFIGRYLESGGIELMLRRPLARAKVFNGPSLPNRGHADVQPDRLLIVFGCRRT